ncbi:phosphatidylethanolamine binding protein [Saccharata proteae CBS 121410]|uniref:Large ribosomal subunit protein mL38 n=1 Tax=Saccharata proteae CBS 121410 TaxID=1314787 RepID=A0A9P4LX92_9PEZI|nr:phosphatidylethanolamine binding protein [Saccharata proteae CBS 121410]
MPAAKQATRQLQACFRATLPTHPARTSALQCRSFTSTTASPEEAQVQQQSWADLDPNTVLTRRDERRLLRSGRAPIGSRRRRAALQQSAQIPFEQLPYQCFQEARKVLQEDRQEKIRAIEQQRQQIAKIQAQDAAAFGGVQAKETRLKTRTKLLEKLKVLADINDPIVKRKFEDGTGDMNKPVYRHLANRKWRQYKRKVIVQRIEQYNIVPDYLQKLEPIVDVSIAFDRRNVQPGDFVESQISEKPANLNVQVFEKGERLVSVVVVDADVPVVESEGFEYRCHFIGANIPIAPTKTAIKLGELSPDSQVALPWLPPTAQKGSPYHRLSVFVLEQKDGQTLDVNAMKERYADDGVKNFKLRSFIDVFKVTPIGFNLFRTQWDEHMEDVMMRNGIEGADIEFRREPSKKLPYKKKDGARYR